MNKLLTVAKREYIYNIKRPAFLIAALGTPLFFVGIFVLSVALNVAGIQETSDLNAVGYVDNPGVITDPTLLEDYSDLFVAYDSEEAARAALDAGELDSYFVIAEDYNTTRQVDILSYESMPEDLDNVIRDLLRLNLVQGQTLRVPVERLLDPQETTLRLEDSGREVDEQGLFGLLLFPVIFAVTFLLATQITSGFLMSGIVEEKTNRVIEVLVTSVSPLELLGGKILGLGLLGLTQLVLWIGVLLLATVLGQDIPFFSAINLQPDLVLFGVLYFVLGYFLVASLMAAFGVLVGSEQESRQVAGTLSLPLFAPYFFVASFLIDSNGTIPVILSLFPLTSPMAMVMRLGIGAVPLVELVASIVILLLTTAIVVWAAVKIFRWGLLLYGKKLNLKDIIRALRGRVEPGIAYDPNTDQQAGSREAQVNA